MPSLIWSLAWPLGKRAPPFPPPSQTVHKTEQLASLAATPFAWCGGGSLCFGGGEKIAAASFPPTILSIPCTLAFYVSLYVRSQRERVYSRAALLLLFKRGGSGGTKKSPNLSKKSISFFSSVVFSCPRKLFLLFCWRILSRSQHRKRKRAPLPKCRRRWVLSYGKSVCVCPGGRGK